MTPEDAEEYTESLGQVFAGSWRQRALAVRLGVPQALGLTFDEWSEQRLGGYVRLSIPERKEAAAELAEEGLTQREIAGVLGISQPTVYRDLSPDSIESRSKRSAVDEQADEPLCDDPDSNESLPFGQDEAEDILAQFDEEHAEPEPDPDPEPTPQSTAHVGRNTGDNEWYTPVEYITAARAAMGDIDLDPASSEAANETVKATVFYTSEDDGLVQPWSGRVWMNPPYAQPLVDRFCTRIAREYSAGSISAACVLVNNGTETNWFQEVAARASAVCFPRGRVKFWKSDRDSATPLQGQAVIYLGASPEDFRQAFSRFGFVVMF